MINNDRKKSIVVKSKNQKIEVKSEAVKLDDIEVNIA